MRPWKALLALLVALGAVAAGAKSRHELIRNGGFEAGRQGWQLSGDFQANDRFGNAHSGAAYAYLATPAGVAAPSLSGTVEQSVRIPAEAVRATLSFWYDVSSHGRGGLDAMHVSVLDAAGRPLETVAVLTTLPKPGRGYRRVDHEMSHHRGRSIRVQFSASTDPTGRTAFRLDDVSLSYELETTRLAAAPRGGPAAAPSPEQAGLAAEMAGDWQTALSIYETLLARQPERADIWLRVADIEAVSGRPEAASAALARAAALSPEDPGIHFRRSQALAVAERPGEALAAVERALALEPGNVEYLRARAKLANWSGDSAVALDSYEAILRLDGADREAELGRARVTAWLGDAERAVEHYREYMRRYPDDAEAHLEYARTEGWRGNYPAGLEALDDYAQQFEPSAAYLAERARLLVGAQRPNAALSLLSPLLDDVAEDSWLQGTYTLALAGSGRPRQALEGLAVLDERYPDTPEVSTVRRLVTTPMRSLLRLVVDSYSDSDSVDRRRIGLEGSLRLAPTSHLWAGVHSGEVSADVASGLAAPDGRQTITTEGVWLRLDQRLGPKALVSLRGEAVTVEGRDSETTYSLGLRLEPADAVTIELSRSRELYGVSPRSLALGVRRDVSRGALRWSPAPRWWLELIAASDDFSDGNRKQELILAPRRAVLRRSRLNLDLGLRGWWLSFDDDPRNGYYAPSDFERYTLAASLYWKIDDDRGLGLTLAPGFLQDETMDGFEFSADANLELTIGIYRAWMLVVRASATENGRAQTGAFSATGAALLLTRRF